MAILFRHNFITCLSGDTKPTADPAAGYGLSTGYRLFETDTNKTYFYSGGAWVENVDGSSAVSTHAAAADPHTGYRLESADHTHASAGAQAGQLGGTAFPGTATTSTWLNGSGSWSTLPAGVGGGDNVTVNTTSLVDVDLDDATPAAPLTATGAATNVKWQHDAGSPANVSAYMYGVPLIVKSTANTINATSVLATAQGLDFAISSGRFYTFEYRLLLWSDTTTVGVQMSVLTTAPVTALAYYFTARGQVGVAAAGTAAEFAGDLSSGSGSTGFKPLNFSPATTLQVMLATLTGSMFTSAATALKVTFANETGTTTVGVMKGSMGFLYDYGTT